MGSGGSERRKRVLGGGGGGVDECGEVVEAVEMASIRANKEVCVGRLQR